MRYRIRRYVNYTTEIPLIGWLSFVVLPEGGVFHRLQWWCTSSWMYKHEDLAWMRFLLWIDVQKNWVQPVKYLKTHTCPGHLTAFHQINIIHHGGSDYVLCKKPRHQYCKNSSNEQYYYYHRISWLKTYTQHLCCRTRCRHYLLTWHLFLPSLSTYRLC